MIRLEKVSFRYATRHENTIRDIDLCIEQGERVLIAGRTGCGKSTLLKAINGIIPSCSHGEFGGDVWIDGVNTRQAAADEIGLKVGTLYQAPDDQIFATTVWDEVAFALENRGVEKEEIRRRVKETLENVGLSSFYDRSVHALSGGQRQRLALAAVLAARPSILILDEPISQLNPAGAASLLQLLLKLNREENMTLIVVEHRVHELYRFFPRLVYLEGRTVRYDGATEGAWTAVHQPLKGLREPEPVRVCRRLSVSPFVADPEQAAMAIRRRYPACLTDSDVAIADQKGQTHVTSTALRMEDVSYTYPGSREETLHAIDMTVPHRRIVAVMGQNGAGKSTLLSLIAGLIRPIKGDISIGESLKKGQNGIGFLRQDTDLMLLYPTVGEEAGVFPKQPITADTARILSWLELTALQDDFPLALSRGQRLRVALASLLAKKPSLLLLDEPTTGQDYESLDDIRRVLRTYRYMGGTVLFCTHDVELAADIADSVLLLNNGRILAEGSARKILADGTLLKAAGLAAPPLTALCRTLQLPLETGCKEVCRHVCKTAVGRS